MSGNYMVVYLTEEQKNLIHGHPLQEDWAFSVGYCDSVQKWHIGADQQENCTNPEFEWLKQLPVSGHTLIASAIPPGCPPEDLHLYTTGSL